MIRQRYFLALLSLCFAMGAFAETNGLRYTYIEGRYVDVEFDDLDADGDGFGIGGSVAVSDDFFLTAGYTDLDLDFGVDAQEFLLGVGYHYGLSEVLDLVGEVGYADVEIDTRFGDFDDNGLFLSGGLRWMVVDQLELNGKLRYVDLDDSGSDTSIVLGGLFHVTADLAIGAGAEISDDADVYSVGIRYYLGVR